MTETTISQRSISHQSWEYERQSPGGIVVGVDCSRESIAALATAATIARERRCALHVVMVLPPFPPYQVNPGVDSRRENAEQVRVSLKDSDLREIMKAVKPEDDWTHQVIVGRPARALTAVAERRCADLIVVGRRRHGPLDRLLAGETTLQVMRMSAVPVLGVEAELDRPRTAVVAIDFFPPSTRAARVARELLGSLRMLYLAYVEPSVDLLPNGFTLPGETRFPGDVAIYFRRLMDGLGAHSGMLAEPVVLNGSPVSAIADFAERVGADVIAVGSHGRSRIERFLLGSVSTGLVRNAHCAVLVTPPSDR